MKVNIRKFQEGGPMGPEDPAMAGAPAEAGMAPEEQGAPMEQGGQEEMMQQLYQMAQEVVQQMGPDAAMALAQAIVEIVQGGGEEQMPAPEEQPVYRMGGKLVRGRR